MPPVLERSSAGVGRRVWTCAGAQTAGSLARSDGVLAGSYRALLRLPRATRARTLRRWRQEEPRIQEEDERAEHDRQNHSPFHGPTLVCSWS